MLKSKLNKQIRHGVWLYFPWQIEKCSRLSKKTDEFGRKRNFPDIKKQ